MYWYSVALAYQYCVLGSGSAALSIVGKLVGLGKSKRDILWTSNDFKLNTFEYEMEPAGQVKLMISEFFTLNKGFNGKMNDFKSVNEIMDMKDDEVLSMNQLDSLNMELTEYLKAKVTTIENKVQKIRYNSLRVFESNFNVYMNNRLFNLECKNLYIASGSPELTFYHKIVNLIKKNQLKTQVIKFDSQRWGNMKADGTLGLVLGVPYKYEFESMILNLQGLGFKSSQLKGFSQFDYSKLSTIEMINLMSNDNDLVEALKSLKYISFLNRSDQIIASTEFYEEGKTVPVRIGSLSNNDGNLRTVLPTARIFSYSLRSIRGFGGSFTAREYVDRKWVDVCQTGIFKYQKAANAAIE